MKKRLRKKKLKRAVKVVGGVLQGLVEEMYGLIKEDPSGVREELLTVDDSQLARYFIGRCDKEIDRRADEK